jgi:hypothetical protein
LIVVSKTVNSTFLNGNDSRKTANTATTSASARVLALAGSFIVQMPVLILASLSHPKWRCSGVSKRAFVGELANKLVLNSYWLIAKDKYVIIRNSVIVARVFEFSSMRLFRVYIKLIIQKLVIRPLLSAVLLYGPCYFSLRCVFPQ